MQEEQEGGEEARRRRRRSSSSSSGSASSTGAVLLKFQEAPGQGREGRYRRGQCRAALGRAGPWRLATNRLLDCLTCRLLGRGDGSMGDKLRCCLLD